MSPVMNTTNQQRTETMNDLVVLAHKMMLTPTQAIAIAGVVDKAADSVGWDRAKMVRTAMRNGELRDYLASVCRKVMDVCDDIPEPRC